jgi:hypothetical protein
MGKQFRLNVADPCHEDWEQMSPVEKGRFCGSCQKQVVDFTDMTDTQIATFFKKSTGSVCGRFMDDQLNRNISIPKKRIPWVKYFFHFTWPLLIASLKSCTQKNNQSKQESVQEETAKITYRTLGAVMPGPELEITHFSKEITGTVVDERGVPIPSASIMIKNTSLGVKANHLGEFVLEIPTIKNVEIEISAIGYETKSFRVDIPNLKNTFQLAPFAVICNYPEVQSESVTTGLVAMELPLENPGFSKEIAGTVVDEEGAPIPFASVMVKGTTSGAQADVDGRFVIDNSSNKNIELEISSVGFETKSFTISNPNMQKTFQLSKRTLNEVIVVGYPTTRCYALMGGVSYISVDKIDSVAENKEAIPQPLTTAIIYPNPSPRGGTITIQLKNNEVSLAQIRILALDGKLMSTHSLNGKDQVRFTVQSDSRWAAGIYLVQLLDQKGKLIQTEKIVLQ